MRPRSTGAASDIQHNTEAWSSDSTRRGRTEPFLAAAAGWRKQKHHRKQFKYLTRVIGVPERKTRLKEKQDESICESPFTDGWLAGLGHHDGLDPHGLGRCRAPTQSVSVVNTPLPVQGSVNASVTGTVGVSALPANLNTTPTTPVYVDTDQSARNGFNVSCFTGNIDSVSGQAACTLLSIPAGRQVVIETISCQAELFGGEGPADVQLIVPNTPFTPGGPDHVSHLLTLTKQASVPGLDIWRMTTPLRAYGSAPALGSVDVGIFFRANPEHPNPQGLSCTISGHMVGQ